LRETAAVLACFTLAALLLAWSRWLAGRRRAAVGHLLLATVTLAAGVFLWRLASSLAPYAPIVLEQPIAELLLEQTGARRFRATLTRLPEGRMQVLELPGHQWRIDARTLAWHEAASSLGLPPLFQVERITTRDTRPGSAPDALVADYALGEPAGEDLWTRVHSGSGWARLAEARRAYGPWRPMANGARFMVRLDGAGIEVEPMNEAAATAMRELR
jgi:hypothetical protein